MTQREVDRCVTDIGAEIEDETRLSRKLKVVGAVEDVPKRRQVGRVRPRPHNV